MSDDMSSQDWQTAHNLARSLKGIDANAVEKLQAFVRTRRDVDGCKSLLTALSKNAAKFMKLSRDQRMQHGVSFIRTEKMAGDYEKLSQVVGPVLDKEKAPLAQARLLGWVARLIRYYATVDEHRENYQRQPGTNSNLRQYERRPSSSPLTAQSFNPGQVAMPPPKRALPSMTEKKEKVTLITAIKTGKARVKTLTGEEITCSRLPSFAPDYADGSCLAEVTRENGKAVRAVFKRWK